MCELNCKYFGTRCDEHEAEIGETSSSYVFFYGNLKNKISASQKKNIIIIINNTEPRRYILNVLKSVAMAKNVVMPLNLGF